MIALRWQRVLAALLLTALVFAVYLPGIGGGYVFDDYPNIVENAQLRVTDLRLQSWLAAAFSSEAGALQRPLSMVTFAVNQYFTGLDPTPMKWTNIAIHALNALLALGLVLKLLSVSGVAGDARRRDWAAFFVAAAWAVHPINFLGVLYIVQRMESLAQLFVFGGLWLYLVGRKRALQGRGGALHMAAGLIGGTALGVLCKESAVLLPLYAWLIEFCLPALRAAPDRRRVRLLFLAVLLIPAIFGIAWLLPRVTAPWAFSTRNFNLTERLMTECRVVLDYMRWTVAPSLRQLTLFHDDYVVSRGWWSPPSTLLAALALFTVAAFATWVRRYRPITALGLLWFLSAQALTATIIPLELVFEHRNYFASLGICLVLADVLLFAPKRPEWRRVGAFLAISALLSFAGMTFLRAREWSDPYRFASTEAAKRPESARAAYSLGRLLTIMTGNSAGSPFIAPAILELDRARRLPQGGTLPDCALLMLAAHTGRPLDPAWWQDMQAKLRRGPIGPSEISTMASLATCARNGECNFPVPDMMATFEAALTRPNADILNIYADYIFNVIRDPDAALAMWSRSIRMRPDVAQYRINVTKALIAVGRFDEATGQIAALRRLGRLGQNEAEASALDERLRNGQKVQPL